MALSLSNVRRTVFGDRYVRIWDVTFDTSYPTGGESLTAADLDLRVVEFVQGDSKGTGWVVQYDYANSKLKVFGVNSAEATAAVQVLDEVADTTNLSTVVVRLMAVGH